MRTFIQYDKDGEIIAVLQTETLPEGVEQPFYIEDKKQGAAEITEDAALKKHAAAELGSGFKFDVAKRRLVKKSAPAAAKKRKRSSVTK